MVELVVFIDVMVNLGHGDVGEESSELSFKVSKDITKEEMESLILKEVDSSVIGYIAFLDGTYQSDVRGP